MARGAEGRGGGGEEGQAGGGEGVMVWNEIERASGEQGGCCLVVVGGGGALGPACRELAALRCARRGERSGGQAG